MNLCSYQAGGVIGAAPKFYSDKIKAKIPKTDFKSLIAKNNSRLNSKGRIAKKRY